MSKLKHTPGPLKVYDHNWSTCSVNNFVSNFDNGEEIDNEDELKERQLADANLYSTAPEMLEIIIKEYKDRNYWSERGYGIITHGQSMVMLKNIIEKATGLKIEEIINE